MIKFNREGDFFYGFLLFFFYYYFILTFLLLEFFTLFGRNSIAENFYFIVASMKEERNFSRGVTYFSVP